ncbi:MAG: MgtC/SapB family protein [Peptococcaceae bacterium]|nr:MgtC/SapB family protein [Peptococcaceae bacterium]
MLQALDVFRDMTFLSVALRLTLAMFCGGLIGLNRERMRRPKGLAGFRTYMMVSVGAALTMLLSQYEYTMVTHQWAEIAGKVGITTDVSRFGAQVINGIGFLGAGTILVTKDNQIKGLTTAASLWASACLGLAIGAGFFEGALMAVCVIILSMYLFTNLKFKIQSQSRIISIYVEVKSLAYLGDVLMTVRQQGSTVLEMNIDDVHNKNRTIYDAEIVVKLAPHLTPDAMLACVSQVEHVKHVHEL